MDNTYTVTITVTDEALTPIEATIVEFHGETKATDINGQVFFYDVPSDTAMNFTINAEGYQSHSVDVTVVDDLSKTVILQTESQATDIADKILEITIYPNPASDYILIKNADQTEISIFNNAGKMMYSEQSNSSLKQIDISEFKEGSYFLLIHKSNKEIESKVFIVE